jgi:hypothetical protein
MGKRKKKSKRRRERAISAFGLRGSAHRYESAPLYQSRFQESDMVWLADEYRERSRSEPSLRLEDFSAQYGVSAQELRAYVPDLSRDISNSVTLWHGTTASRARSILREGFSTKKSRSGRKIFFAARPGMARGHAKGRASEDDPPAVLMCSIDLNRYSDYERRGREVYIFRYERIASEVITQIEGSLKHSSEEQEKPKKTDVSPTDVALTFNSGQAGIAYWINTCLKLKGSDIIYEDHEAVGKIKEWLDAQAHAGRFGAVPDDEMLEQMRKFLPQYFQ